MTLTQHLLCALGLLMLVLVAYAPIRSAGFLYEDQHYHRSVATFDQVRPSLTGGTYRPLMYLSWSLQAKYTPSAFAFHVVNLGLHVIAVALVGILLWRVGASPAAAWVGASLFALHPIQVEAVAYLSSRPELFAAIGVLAACVLATGSTVWHLIGVLLAILFAFAGKETAIVALALVPLTVLVRQARTYGVLEAFGMAGTIIGLALVTGLTIGIVALRQLAPPDWTAWMLVQATAVVRLLGMTIWPVAQTVDYDYDRIALGWRVICAAALVGLTTWTALQAGTFWSSRTVPLVFGLAWLLISVWPRFLVYTPRSYFNEHQFFTSFIGVAITAAAVWDRYVVHSTRNSQALSPVVAG